MSERAKQISSMLLHSHNLCLAEFEDTDSDDVLAAMNHINAALRVFGVEVTFESSDRIALNLKKDS